MRTIRPFRFSKPAHLVRRGALRSGALVVVTAAGVLAMAGPSAAIPVGGPTVQDQTVQAPYATNATYVLPQALARGATNPAGGALSFVVDSCTPVSHPSVTISADGTVKADQSVPVDVTCSFHAVDKNAVPSNEATLHVSVPAPAAPTVGNPVLQQQYDTDVSYTNKLGAGATDPVGGGLAFHLDPARCSYNGVTGNGLAMVRHTGTADSFTVEAIGTDFAGPIQCPFGATDILGRVASGTVTINITGVASEGRVFPSANPSNWGQAVTLTAAAGGHCHDCPVATGSVTYKDGTTVLGTATLVRGEATLTTSALTIGMHHITAVYSGDLFFLSGTLDPLDQQVIKSETTTTLTPAATTASVNQPVIFTARVAAVTGPSTPTGNVSFYVDGAATPAATVALSDTGSASFVGVFSAGMHRVVAYYEGDANYFVSTSPATVDVRCDTVLTGRHGAITATHGTTCVTNATITGGISVARGAVLDLEKSTVSGSISATAPSSVRICGSHTGAISISGATGYVLLGDPADGCAANTIDGALTAANNTGGVVIIGNTVTGPVTAANNSGAGPFPGQPGPVVSGNHH